MQQVKKVSLFTLSKKIKYLKFRSKIFLLDWKNIVKIVSLVTLISSFARSHCHKVCPWQVPRLPGWSQAWFCAAWKFWRIVLVLRGQSCPRDCWRRAAWPRPWQWAGRCWLAVPMAAANVDAASSTDSGPPAHCHRSEAPAVFAGPAIAGRPGQRLAGPEKAIFFFSWNETQFRAGKALFILYFYIYLSPRPAIIFHFLTSTFWVFFSTKFQ